MEKGTKNHIGGGAAYLEPYETVQINLNKAEWTQGHIGIRITEMSLACIHVFIEYGLNMLHRLTKCSNVRMSSSIYAHASMNANTSESA